MVWQNKGNPSSPQAVYTIQVARMPRLIQTISKSLMKSIGELFASVFEDQEERTVKERGGGEWNFKILMPSLYTTDRCLNFMKISGGIDL